MNRFDIPSVVTEMINKAIEIDLLDAGDVLALGATHGKNFDGIVDEIIEYAYSNIHHNNDHDIMVPFCDSYYQQKIAMERVESAKEVKPEPKEVEDFGDRFKIFFEGCKQINQDYMTRTFPGMKMDEFTYNNGRRYRKVIRSGSVHCFVDTNNGDVLKAASWSAPAKHARGNIFDDQNGLGSMGEYGPAYLR